ncbi:MAG: peptide deformylase [Chloroflexi bacterium]|nr:peptide deformylase [Chloroflexota bacterium]
MALLKLRIVPDPVLRQKAKRIGSIDARLQRLVDDMIETMHHEGGVGLAANQVGVLQRVVVIQLAEDEEARVLVNPQMVERQGQREVEEGCLSIPGYRGTLFRSLTVKVKAQDRNGKPYRIKAEGLLAQALEHELDHLNGILYIDHLESHEKLRKLEAEPPQPVEAGVG